LIDVHPEDQLKTLMAILYFFSEEPVKNDEQQDCCLIVEVHAPDWIKDELIQLAAEEAIEDATHGYLELGGGAPLFWHLLQIV
jgi:hypothetical protein